MLQKRSYLSFLYHYTERVLLRKYVLRVFIGCLKLQDSIRKRVANYRALLQEMSCIDKASFASSLPCTNKACLLFTAHLAQHFYISGACAERNCNLGHPLHLRHLVPRKEI